MSIARAFLAAVTLGVSLNSVRAVDSPRQQIAFDADWRFALGDPAAAEKPGFDDSSWHHLNVPHDWGIEGSFDEKNPTGGAGGFLPAGVGWYRKSFTLPPVSDQSRVFVEFDGVMANSDVWINGFHLGKRPNGYVSFQYELTGHLNSGLWETNILAVRADNSGQPASRWYAGAGIYRHVRLMILPRIHIDQWGMFVTTPTVWATNARVRLQTTVVNQSQRSLQISVQARLLAPDGAVQKFPAAEAATMAAGGSLEFHQEVPVKSPHLWDIDRPALYRCVATVLSSGATLDEDSVTFGIRDPRFEPDTGFWLNGRNLKLKGVCLHHDAGALGAAVPLRAWERRLESLKQVGCNAIRTAHNPVAPEFLDLCDRMGFLVMDEMFDCWTVAKNRYDYHLYFNEWSKVDTRDVVRRDRNHPSIVVYSAGNEIRDTPQAEAAKKILSGLVEVFHQNDPTRPVSQALFRPNVSHDYENGLADVLDVVGQNYREGEILDAHRAKPTRKILGTENGHDRNVWLALRDNAPYAGQFLWSGIDYLGESRRWPIIGSGSGLFDRTGTPRPRAFERQSWWSDQSMVHIARRLGAGRDTPADPGFEPLNRRESHASDWTPRNSGPHEESVEAFSNCEEVELFLNGKSLGTKPLRIDAAPRTWKIQFEPGVIRAVGKRKGEVVATHELQTAGKPARIVLKTDGRKLPVDWDEIAYVQAEVVDDKGVQVPDAADLVRFKLDGPGAILAVDNGDNSSHEPFRADSRHVFQGRCVAILRATGAPGKLQLSATASNLAPGSLTLDTVKFKASESAGGLDLPNHSGLQASTATSFKFAFAAYPWPGWISIFSETRFGDDPYGFDLGTQPDLVLRGGVEPLTICTSGQPFFLSVAIPEGNYRVRVTLGDPEGESVTTVKAESRRLMLENVRTKTGESLTRNFAVNVRTPRIGMGGQVRLKPRELGPPPVLHWDDKLTLEFSGSRPCVRAVEIEKVEDAVTIYLAGDSTVTDQPREPWNSWGQMLPRFFNAGVAIANHAESGESLPSFLGAKRLDKILSAMKRGDYLFIQFGHNDQKDKRPGAGASTTYKTNLLHFIAETRKRGATPVLVTPMERKAGVTQDTLGDFPEVVRQVAREQEVPLIDLHAMSKVLYRALGENLGKAFQDGTHHNNYGSYELANCVVEGIRANKLPLAKFLAEDVKPFDPAHPDSVNDFKVPASPVPTGDKPEGN